MGNRLLDWFSVLMSQGGREKPIKNASKGIRFVIKFSLLCHPLPGHPTLRLFSIGPKKASGRGRKKPSLGFPHLTRCVRFLSPPPPLVLVRRIDFPIKYCPFPSRTVFPFIFTFVFFTSSPFLFCFLWLSPLPVIVCQGSQVDVRLFGLEHRRSVVHEGTLRFGAQ